MKTRLWDTEKKVMISPEYGADLDMLLDMEGGVHILTPTFPYAPDQYIRADEGRFLKMLGCQITGKQYYVGDILCFKHDKQAPSGGFFAGTYDFHPENSVHIIFDEGRFYVPGRAESLYDMLTRSSLEWEVIGNIYENPELL